MLAWENRGISFHAVVRIAGHERAGLERQMNDCAPLLRGLDVQARYCAAQPFIAAETSSAPNESGVASGRCDQGDGVPVRSERPGLNARFAKSCCPDWGLGQCRFLVDTCLSIPPGLGDGCRTTTDIGSVNNDGGNTTHSGHYESHRLDHRDHRSNSSGTSRFARGNSTSSSVKHALNRLIGSARWCRKTRTADAVVNGRDAGQKCTDKGHHDT